MKLLFKLLTSLFIILSLLPLIGEAQTGSPTLWEKAALGKVPGITLVTIRGYNNAITTTGETIWPESTAYTMLAANMSNPTISSSNAADAAAGTGARTVSVTCIDSAYAETTTTYTLNGQTGVALTASCMTVNSMQVVTAGSGNVNAGIIYVGTGTVTTGKPAVVHGEIQTGESIFQSAFYGVPAGYSLLCRGAQVSSYGVTAAQTITAYFETITNLGPKMIVYLGAINQAGNSSYSEQNRIIFIAAKTQLGFSAYSAASTGPVYLTSQCLKINNTWLVSAQDLL